MAFKIAAAALLAWQCLGLSVAHAAPRVVSGAVTDPRGDASVSPSQGPPAADVQRVTAVYDRDAGSFALDISLYDPAPTAFQLKSMFAAPNCSGAADMLDFDLGGSAVLRIGGKIPVAVTRHTEHSATRLTETWTGTELRGLDLGCVRGSVSTGGIGNFGLDEFAAFPLS